MGMREGFAFDIQVQVVRLEVAADVIERFVHRIGELQKFVIAFVHGSGADHVAPVDQLVPVFPAVNQN